MKIKKLIECVEIHRYEKCNEFSTPLMNEVIEKLKELEELKEVVKVLVLNQKK